ncbi:MauE/DoxX family redox-associated membrane protein [Microbacterium sp. 22242]|uniref:MauE/DoxX family redox-associated membrane protein n=1 Tax=Microbacterium sp. 22242 TaxID=3453896 RepID=UPI003F84FA62
MPANPVETVLMVATGFVAFVLLLSGVAKAGRGRRTLESMTALAVPGPFRRRWIAAAVPLWELGLAVALLILPGGYRAAAAALSLVTFAVFTVFVVGVLRRGEEVDCGCFGALSADDRVTGWTATRNAVLMLAAAVIVVTSPAHGAFVVELFTTGLTPLLAALVWLAVATAALAISLVRVRRGSRAAYESTGGPSAASHEDEAVAREGAAVPASELVSAEGVTIPLHALGAGAPVLLVFLSTECGKCAGVARRLPEWQRAIGPSVLLRVATSSRPDSLRVVSPEAMPFAYFGAASAKRALGAEGIPSAVLLGGMHHPFVASPVARGDEIENLVRGIVVAQSPGRDRDTASGSIESR